MARIKIKVKVMLEKYVYCPEVSPNKGDIIEK